ncbi:PTS sugar transporter subunit IIA [Sporolactobacillus shoreicorticis]|uniref:PTS sugar transporter subunit IIA n=1 Tax=Sporolactobacillus shoreicorticis TaxID=1923877 RepID=A0ABW5S3P7_9BACL|nr:PTS sugar transporter subunit IIA [Sporolactobacillus shoreicorticis]MCO7124703.1 PTS sugar transporter subunit IIA [Sporolactobacillus shoreicorticis]
MKNQLFIISHNDFAEGIVKSVQMIAGKNTNIKAFGLQMGEHPSTITEKIEARIKPDERVFVLADLIGGSVENDATRLLNYPNVCLIGGINLPLVLEIVLTNPQTDEQIDHILESAKGGLRRIRLESGENSEAEKADNFFQ